MRSLRQLLSALLVCLSAGLCIMVTQSGPLPPTTHDGLPVTWHRQATRALTTAHDIKLIKIRSRHYARQHLKKI